jgi:hypothetical protein
MLLTPAGTHTYAGVGSTFICLDRQIPPVCLHPGLSLRKVDRTIRTLVPLSGQTDTSDISSTLADTGGIFHLEKQNLVANYKNIGSTLGTNGYR